MWFNIRSHIIRFNISCIIRDKINNIQVYLLSCYIQDSYCVCQRQPQIEASCIGNYRQCHSWIHIFVKIPAEILHYSVDKRICWPAESSVELKLMHWTLWNSSPHCIQRGSIIEGSLHQGQRATTPPGLSPEWLPPVWPPGRLPARPPPARSVFTEGEPQKEDCWENKYISHKCIIF